MTALQTQPEVLPQTEVVPTPPTPKVVEPPSSYATYPGAYYIDPETKKSVRSVPSRFMETKSFVAKSPIAGLGCFAKSDIKSGEFIEECSAILTDTTTKHNKDWVITQYFFTWPCEHDDPICNKNGSTYFVPTGNALLYNHSDTPNSYWIYDKAMKRIILSALRDIKENEELTWYYGHGYASKLRGDKPGKCGSCEQRQKEMLEKQKLKDAIGGADQINPIIGSSTPMLGGFAPTKEHIEEKKKQLIKDWFDNKEKEKSVPEDSIEFRSMVLPEKKLDDTIQEG